MADGKRGLIALSKEIKVKANGENKWDPEKYTRWYVFVFLYNKVAGNPKEFGLSANSNDNTDIEGYIRKNVEFLFAKYELYNFYKQGFDIGKFKKEMGEYSLVGKHDYNEYFKDKPLGEMLSIDEADAVMEAKYQACHSKFMEIKIPTDPTAQIPSFDDKGGVDYKTEKKDSYFPLKMKAANMQLQAKKKAKRRTVFRLIRSIALTGLFGAGLVASLAAIFSGGGAMLATLFGTSLFATGAGAAVTGIVGGIASFGLGKFFLGKVIKYYTRLQKQREDMKDFMNGTGKYAPEGKQLKGYKDIKNEYDTAMEARAIMVQEYGDAKKEIESKFNKEYKDGTTQIDREHKAYKAALEALLARNPHPSEAELEQLRTDHLKTKYKDAQHFITEYQNMVKRKHPAYCANVTIEGDKHWEEVAKNAVYDNMVQRTGSLFVTVRSQLGEYAPSQDRPNNKTVGDFVRGVNDAVSNPSIDLNELANQYIELTSDQEKKKFATQSALGDHEKLQQMLENAIVKKIKDVAYNEPLQGDTAEFLEDTLSSTSRLKAAIERAGTGGESSKIKDLAQFIYTESSNSADTLDNSLGVSIRNQFKIHSGAKNAIIDACEHFEGSDKIDSTSSDRPALEAIAQRIENLRTFDEVESISDEIDAKFSSKDKVWNYLDFMLTKKASEITLKVSDMPFATSPKGIEIATDIQNLKEADVVTIKGTGESSKTGSADLQKIEKIRNKILNSSMSPDEKKIAQVALEQQTMAIEAKRRNTTLESAFEHLGGANNIEEQLKSIEKISYSDDFNTNDAVSTLYTNFKGYTPQVKDYLKMKLSERIQDKCIERALSDEFTGQPGPETISKIAKFYHTIADCHYLSPAQKNRIFTAIDENFGERIFQGLLIKANDMLKGNFDEIKSEIQKYLHQGYSSGGLKDYFALNTSSGDNIKDLLEKMEKIINSSDKLMPKIYKGKTTIDTTMTVKLLLNLPTDEIESILTQVETMNTLTYDYAANKLGDTRFLNLGGIINDGGTGYSASTPESDLGPIGVFRREYENIVGSGDTDVVKLIKLMNLRKAFISLHQDTLKKYIISVHGNSTLEGFFTTDHPYDPADPTNPAKVKKGSDLLSSIGNNFKEFASILDSTITTLKGRDEIKYLPIGNTEWAEGSDINTSRIISSVNDSNITSYQKAQDIANMNIR